MSHPSSYCSPPQAVNSITHSELTSIAAMTHFTKPTLCSDAKKMRGRNRNKPNFSETRVSRSLLVPPSFLFTPQFLRLSPSLCLHSALKLIPIPRHIHHAPHIDTRAKTSYHASQFHDSLSLSQAPSRTPFHAKETAKGHSAQCDL